MFQNEKKYDTIKYQMTQKEALLCDYAVLENETGGTTEVALALLPDGIAEGTVLIFENFEYHIKESTP